MMVAGDIQIGVGELKALIGTDARIAILDVREEWEYKMCALPDSRLLPLSELPRRIDELRTGGLQDEDMLVIVCHHGMRSFQATLFLRRNGFDNAVNLSGGIDAWARDIDPAMQRY